MSNSDKQLDLAVRRRDITPAARRILEGVVLSPTKGFSEPDSTTVLFTAVLIDDSYSILEAGNIDGVRDGHNVAIEELKGAIQAPIIRLKTQYMKGYVLNDWLPLDECRDMNQANYEPDGGTPLYDSTIVLARSLVDQVTRAKTETFTPSSRILIVTDGEDQGSNHSEADVREVLSSVQSQGVHAIALMGIDNGYTDYHAVAKSMGIKKVITPTSDGRSIRRAFQTWSRDGFR